MTDGLIARHPLGPDLLARAVLAAWRDIFDTRVGAENLRFGQHIFPAPQVMGFFLHELIPVVVARENPGWRRGVTKGEKDLHFETDPSFSVEIKTSSDSKHVFGNRSYAQKATERSRPKDGYFLTVNFRKWCPACDPERGIVVVRFGWLDHADWLGQSAATGQQARLGPDVYRSKLREIYRSSAVE